MPVERPHRHLRAALAAAVALLVVGCATPDDRTPQERAADEALGRQVEAALQAAPYLDADHVTVEVRRGVARLTGLVADDEDLRTTLRVCSAVPGVRTVDDRLEIMDFSQPGGSDGPAR